MRYLPFIFRRDGGNADHHAVLDALKQSLDDAHAQADELPKELVIDTSTGMWLDVWGEWFGLRRYPNESDEDFRSRIKATVTQDRLTLPALIELVKSVLGEDTNVTIFEPHTKLMRLNGAKLGGSVLPGADYYRIGVTDVIVDKPITDELRALIEKYRPAGTKIVLTYQP